VKTVRRQAQREATSDLKIIEIGGNKVLANLSNSTESSIAVDFASIQSGGLPRLQSRSIQPDFGTAPSKSAEISGARGCSSLRSSKTYKRQPRSQTCPASPQK